MATDTLARKPNLTSTIELIESSDSGDTISLGGVIETFSHRGFGPLLLVPALITLLPTGAIPGVPIITALLIISFSIQLLVGREQPWTPQKLARLSTPREKFIRLLEKARPITQKIDCVIKPRLQFATGKLGLRLVALLAIVLAVSFIPLGAIPFAVAIPSGILVILSLGLVAQDGLLILLGFGLSLAATGLIYY